MDFFPLKALTWCTCKSETYFCRQNVPRKACQMGLLSHPGKMPLNPQKMVLLPLIKLLKMFAFGCWCYRLYTYLHFYVYHNMPLTWGRHSLVSNIISMLGTLYLILKNKSITHLIRRRRRHLVVVIVFMPEEAHEASTHLIGLILYWSWPMIQTQ